MKSLQWPNMITQHEVQTVEGIKATKQNVHLTLGSEKGEFKFDPFFGIRLKKYTFEQNSVLLQDLLIDEIYEQLTTFVPQIQLKRSDIKIRQERGTVYVDIKCINRANFTTNLFSLELFNTEG